MTLLHDAAEAKKFDTRVVERHIQRGAVTADELEKSLKTLSDDSENAEFVSIEAIAADTSIK